MFYVNTLHKIGWKIKKLTLGFILKHIFQEIYYLKIVEKFSNLGKEHSLFLGHQYIANLTTDECLNNLDMIKIDEDIKTLFSMMGQDLNNPFSIGKTPQIKTFFDCGDGEGFNFNSPYEYKH